MRVPLFSLLICIATALPARAEIWFDPDRLTGVAGAFCQQRPVGEVIAPDTQAQKIDLLPDIPDIIWPGAAVPAMPGISFGIRSVGTTADIYYPVLIEVTHPPFLNSGTTRQSYVTELGGEEPSINAYSFDTVEEMVPGPWRFRAWHNGALLYDVTFQVVAPELAPGVGDSCGGDFMS